MKDIVPGSHTYTPLAAEAPPESLRARLLIFFGYLALGVVFTWPLALHLGDGVIQKGGLPVDAGQGVWNLWWARSSILAGQNPFATSYLFYPFQIDLFFQTLSLPNAILAAPVLLGVGPVAAFNTVALLSFGLAGYFSYRLARTLVDDRLAALVAGFVFAFTPYHIQRLWSGPMELIAIHWIPLYILLLLRALARPGFGRLLGAALALLVTTLASQYYGLYVAVYTAAHAGLAAIIAPRRWRLPTLGAALAVGVLWVLGLAPFLLATGDVGAAVLEDWYERQVYHSVALVDLIVPNIQHPLWGALAFSWQSGLHPFGLEAGAAPGLFVYALCGLALWRAWRRAWPWATLALLCLLLAMGPQLRLTELASPVPGPFLLLDLIGPFRNSSRPSVFVALMLIPLAALSAIGLASLAERTKNQDPRTPNGQSVLGSRFSVLLVFRWLLVAGLLFESLVAPWPITELSAGPEYAALNADPLPGAVLELPPRNNDSVYLLNQICHGRPLIGGYLARLPDYPLARYPSALKGLWEASKPAADILDLNPAPELAALGVRFVVLDLTQLPRFQVERLRTQLAVSGIERFSTNEQREIYAVDPAAARISAVLGAGWYDAEQDGGRVWRWMQGRAEIGLIAPAETAAQLEFVATAYGEARPLRIWQGDRLLVELAVPAAPYDQHVALSLIVPPGQSSLTLESPPVISPEGRSLSLSIESLALTPIPSVPGYAARPAAPPPPTLPMIQGAPCTGMPVKGGAS